jgi:DNA-directed RNA polymerase beta subunit
MTQPSNFLSELKNQPSYQYGILDFDGIRKATMDNVVSAVNQRFPVENDNYTLSVSDVGYEDKDKFSLADQKEAILKGRSLGRRLKGRWVLTDKATGKPLSQTGRVTLVNVPYLTPRGTYIRNGHEMTMSHVLRLNPGVYTRTKANGLYEAHVNVEQGTGQPFKVEIDPENGVFNLRKGNVNARLYPVLRSMGIEDKQIKEMWGEELLNANRLASSGTMVTRNLQKLIPKEAAATSDATKANYVTLSPEDAKTLLESFGEMRLDPGSTELSLGKRFDKVSPDMLLHTSRKLLGLARGTEKEDNRDSLEYQKVYGPAEILAERIVKDGGRLGRTLLWKATNKKNLDWMTSGALNPHVDGVFNESKLAQYVDGSSPFDAIDAATKITRLGEGGLSDTRMAPDDMRLVQNSFKGFIDPVRAPESLQVGLSGFLSQNVRKGHDGLLYTQLYNPRTGKREWVDSKTAARAKIATSEYLKSKDPYLPIVYGDRGVTIVPKQDVDYYIDDDNSMFSLGANIIPFKGGVKSLRLTMGSKYATQAIPLVNREAALTRSADTDNPGGSVEGKIGAYTGAVKAPKAGVVKQVRKDKIIVEHLDGERKEYELYDNFPANQKGYLRSIPQVKAGDTFKKGQALASSNYTDDEGNFAGGLNLRTAFLNYKGQNYEDAIVISEGAAKKMTSEHMYHHRVPKEKSLHTDTKRFVNIYPGKFTAEQIKKLGPDGLVKAGTVVHKGDPLILGVRENEPSPGTAGRRTFSNVTETWEHDYPGVVTDVVSGRKNHMVYTRANAPMKVGDKMSNRYGAKGVVAAVIPDGQMPLDKKGKPYEVMMSPLSIVTRTNPAQLIEAAYGKIAEKTGKPVTLPAFMDENAVEKVLADLAKYNLSDTEDLTDPETGKTIPKVFTGNSYYYKLKHTAESKEAGRGTAGYTMENIPASGGYEGSKRLGGLETSGLVGHSAMKVLKDAKLIRGQTNDEFWRDFKFGKTPVLPNTPLVHDKFFAHLKGAGINVNRDKNRINIFGMTNKDVNSMTGGREVKSSDTFETNTFRPIDGGLFGSDIFGKDGDQWGFIQLEEPIPNPVMSDSLRRALNLTLKDFEAIAEGRQELNGKTGGKALTEALGKLDLDQEIKYTMEDIKRGSASRRDNAIKRYRALASMKEKDLHPKDFMLDRVPVLPPKFRPITSMEGMTMVADANYLYKNLLEANNDFKEAKQKLPSDMLAEPRGQLYKGFKAVTGLHDPDDVKLKQKNVGGLLKWVFGKGSPKHGAFQRRVVSTSVDTVGRGTATPNPALKLNEVGLPEEQAWKIYEPFVVKGMIKNGYKATDAVKMTSEKHPVAYDILQKVVQERPIILNRAPSLHKFSLMGFWPRLSKGSTLQVSPSIVVPFNLDFDGDAVNFHVPVSRAAAEEVAQKMMPEQNLLDVRGF